VAGSVAKAASYAGKGIAGAKVGLSNLAGEVPELHSPRKQEFYSSGGRASQPAPAELLQKLKARGYEVYDGPDIQRHLTKMRANASTFGTKELLLRLDPRKLEAIEEWLHNVQQRIGIDPGIRELHVASFMHRHSQMLGLDKADTLKRLLFEQNRS
jgi:hypothetical protein